MQEEKKQTFWQVMKRLLEPAFFLKKEMIIISFVSCFQAFQVIFGIRNSAEIVRAFETWSELWWKFQLFAFLAINVVIAFLLRWRTRQYNTIFLYELDKKLDSLVFKKFFFMNWNSIDILGTGKTQSIIGEGTGARSELAGFIFQQGLRNLFWAIFSFWLIFFISKIFFIASIVFILGIGYLVFNLNKRIQEYRKVGKEMSLEYNKQMTKMIQSRFEILQNHKTHQEIANSNALTDKMKFNNFKKNDFTYLMYDTPLITSNLIRVFVILFIGMAIFSKTSSIATFVALMWCFGNISQVIFNFVDSHRSVYDKMIHLEKLRNFLDQTPNTLFDKWSLFRHKNWEICISNLSFAYNKTSVFQNFSLDIKGWTKTAFVGESWGGKTTLIKLLAGYIKPNEGDIIVDWQKLSEVKLTDYYRHVGYLTQDPSVFDGTIHDNLVYALDTEPSKEELEKIIKLAKCEFIREFEKWLETEIGERWVRLSWGQKQRVAIAKIMLKNPNIILLDEPTSALDSFNEEQISIALHNLFKGKTVIVVAHRLQTVKQADRILLFEQGKIIEEWTHDELVKLNWRYKKMLDLQSWF